MQAASVIPVCQGLPMPSTVDKASLEVRMWLAKLLCTSCDKSLSYAKLQPLHSGAPNGCSPVFVTSNLRGSARAHNLVQSLSIFCPRTRIELAWTRYILSYILSTWTVPWTPCWFLFDFNWRSAALFQSLPEFIQKQLLLARHMCISCERFGFLRCAVGFEFPHFHLVHFSTGTLHQESLNVHFLPEWSVIPCCELPRCKKMWIDFLYAHTFIYLPFASSMLIPS